MKNTKNLKRGFTLTELVIAGAILILLVLFVASLFNDTSKTIKNNFFISQVLPKIDESLNSYRTISENTINNNFEGLNSAADMEEFLENKIFNVNASNQITLVQNKFFIIEIIRGRTSANNATSNDGSVQILYNFSALKSSEGLDDTQIEKYENMISTYYTKKTNGRATIVGSGVTSLPAANSNIPASSSVDSDGYVLIYAAE